MKKILGLAFAGAMLIACGSSNKNATGMQSTTASTAEPTPGYTPPANNEATPSNEGTPSTQPAPLTEPTPPSTQPMPNSTSDQNMNQNPPPSQNPTP